MATTFDSSLFGGQALPADLQRQLDEKQAMEFAQLTPSQQLGNLGFSAGRAIGRGLGGVFGVDVQDPTVRQATMIRQLSQGLDLKTPEGLNSYADRLMANNLPAQAAQIAQMARDAARETAETGLKNAQAEKAINFQQAQADKTQVRNLLADVETRLGKGEEVSQSDLNKAKLAYQEKGQPIDRFDPVTQTVVRIPGIDMSIYPNLTKAFNKVVSPAGGLGGGQVSVLQTPASEEAKRNRLAGLEGSSAQLQTTLDTITQTKDLIGKNTTGWGAYLSSIPSSEAMTLADNTDTIKASVALTKLKEMKQESKTGASGLGALNMKELETIQSILGKLNPKSANYATDLAKVEKFFIRAQKALDEEVRLTKGGTPTQQQQRPSTPTSSPDVAPKPSAMSGQNPQLQPERQYGFEETVKATFEHPSNKGKTLEQVRAAVSADRAKNPNKYKD